MLYEKKAGGNKQGKGAEDQQNQKKEMPGWKAVCRNADFSGSKNRIAKNDTDGSTGPGYLLDRGCSRVLCAR